MIGVYDSGYGGLSVLRRLLDAFPEDDFVYLGDSGRAPYGGRDVHTLLDFAEQAIERLFDEGCGLILVACNTVSCVALRHLQRRYCRPGGPRRILGVTIPAAEAAVRVSDGAIGLVATERTVRSGTYAIEIAKLSDAHRLTAVSAPLLASIVEEGWEQTPIAHEAVRRYTVGLQHVDTLVLGCTHYPFLLEAFRAALPPAVMLLDPADEVVRALSAWRIRHPDVIRPGMGSLQVLCTGDPQRFASHGARFLGRALPPVRPIAERGGRLAPRQAVDEPIGQVVRGDGGKPPG